MAKIWTHKCGDIVTKPPTKEYEETWDRIFKPKGNEHQYKNSSSFKEDKK